MRVAIAGAGGTIAPAIVRDLAESDEVSELLLIDPARERAQAVADAHGGGKATVVEAIDSADLLLNAGPYRTNLEWMRRCLAAGCDYFDLGGLYHVAAEQYAQTAPWRAAGCTAILGLGAGPGKTNLMARAAAEALGCSPDTVRCASAGYDETPPDGFSTPYAVTTLIDELTLAPMIVRDGIAQGIAPLTDGGAIAFPEPVGTRPSLFTLHSEVLTLPRSLGAQAADFRLALAPAVLAGLRERIAAPDADHPPPLPPSPRTWSAQHVEVSGEGRTVVATAITRPHERWGLGGGIVSTGTVISAVARLHARGELDVVAGVHSPEAAIEPAALFAELEPRGCTVTITPTTTEVPFL